MLHLTNHPKQIAGMDMKALANEIGNLHYESLAELLSELATKLNSDARKDLSKGRGKLADTLEDAAFNIGDAYMDIRKAWLISKPFMK